MEAGLLAAIISGALWGAAWGAAKYLLLWGPLFRPGVSQGRIGAAVSLSLLLNAAVLLTPYLLRSRLPFPLGPCLIAAALALSLLGRWPVLLRARRLGEASDFPAEAPASTDPEEE